MRVLSKYVKTKYHSFDPNRPWMLLGKLGLMCDSIFLHISICSVFSVVDMRVEINRMAVETVVLFWFVLIHFCSTAICLVFKEYRNFTTKKQSYVKVNKAFVEIYT